MYIYSIDEHTPLKILENSFFPLFLTIIDVL